MILKEKERVRGRRKREGEEKRRESISVYDERFSLRRTRFYDFSCGYRRENKSGSRKSMGKDFIIGFR